MNLIKLLIASFAFMSCAEKELKDFYFPVLVLTPGPENTRRLSLLENKTIQFRDSVGNKLNFMSRKIVQSSTKCDLADKCNGEKFDLEIIHLQLSLVSEKIFLEYLIDIHLDNICYYSNPKVIINFELTEMNSRSRNNILMLDTDKPDDQGTIDFGNRFIEDTSFRRVDYMNDTSGKKIIYKDIWSPTFEVEEIQRNTCFDMRHTPYQKTSVPNEELFFFNKEFGIVAFRLKDGNQWVLHQIF